MVNIKEQCLRVLVTRLCFFLCTRHAAVEEYQGLQEWFQMETEKYTALIQHRHTAEIEAFTEQLRLKDEKLEAFRWRAVSMDVEAARLRSRIHELEGRLARHEKHSAALEALLQDRESENRALEEQLETLQAQALGVEICTPARGSGQDDGLDDQCIACSPVDVVQRTMSSGSSRHQEGAEVSKYETKLDELVTLSPEDHKEDATEALVVSVGDLACAVAAAATSVEHERRHDAPASRQSFRSEIEEEEEEVCTEPGNAHTTGSSQEATSELALVVVPPGHKSSAWKTDIHALAVSYKIKRLKQQLLVLERLANECKDEEAAATKPSGSEASCSGGGGSGSRQQPRSRYHTMMSFLSKHVRRYQSLDDKIDDLCARMVRGADANTIHSTIESIPGRCVDVSVSSLMPCRRRARGARGGARERRASARARARRWASSWRRRSSCSDSWWPRGRSCWRRSPGSRLASRAIAAAVATEKTAWI